jgi:hypothetical protein
MSRGKRLREYLLEKTDHPGSHYVIAHSHGALVTLYALRDAELSRRIEGVVSLSTPYLIARRRQLSILGGIAAVLGIFGLAGLGLFLSRLPFAYYLDSTDPWYLGVGAFVLGLIMQYGVGGACLGILLGISKLTEWFLRTMAIPEIHPKRLLVVRGPSDEASTLISLFHALELMITADWGRRGPFDSFIEAKVAKLTHWLGKVWDRRPRRLTRLVAIWLGIALAIIAGAMFVTLWLWIYRRAQFDLWARSGWSPEPRMSLFWIEFRVFYHFALSMFPTWALALLGALALPAVLAGGILSTVGSGVLTFGILCGALFVLNIACTALLAITSVPELGPAAATIVVAVEASPPGEYTVVHGADLSNMDAFLTHSWSYTHPAALKAITKWLGSPKPAGEPLVKLPDPSPAARRLGESGEPSNPRKRAARRYDRA